MSRYVNQMKKCVIIWAGGRLVDDMGDKMSQLVTVWAEEWSDDHDQVRWVYSWYCLNVGTDDKDYGFMFTEFWKGKGHIFYRCMHSQMLQELSCDCYESWRQSLPAGPESLSLSVNRRWHEVRFCGGGVCWMWQCFPARTVDYLGAGPHWHLLFAIQNIKDKWKWVALKQNSSLVHCPEAHGIRGTSGEKGQTGSLQTEVSIPP